MTDVVRDKCQHLGLVPESLQTRPETASSMEQTTEVVTPGAEAPYWEITDQMARRFVPIDGSQMALGS